MLESDGPRCIGLRTITGKCSTAKITLPEMGLSLNRIIPSIGWPVVAHIQVSTEEAKRLKGIPAMFPRDIGSFFDPDISTR